MRKSSTDPWTHQKTVGIILLVLAFLGIVVAMVLASGDDDELPPGETTTTTEPPMVDDGPYQDEITRALKKAGFEDRDEWDDDWDQVGVVTERGEKSLKVMTPTKYVFLTSGTGDGECYKPIPITDMGTPGDIVGWSDDGEDSTVCEGEFALLWDAPQEPAPQG